MIRCKPEAVHQQDIDLLREQMRHRKEKLSLAPSKNPSNTVRNHGFKKKTETLSIDHLDQILKLDLEQQLLIVEPKMTVLKITRLLLPYQLMLPVVPEFSSITIGGAIMGASLESSSHRFGQFNDLCLSYELILADGTLLTASAEEYSDLFYAIPGSYGSLALLTAVTIKLQRAKKYVHLNYTRYWNHSHLVDDLRNTHSHDFVEGLIFSKSWSVSVVGNLVDEPKQFPLQRQKRAYKKWYYQHILDKTEKGSHQEVMPLEDYLFRLDRGAFWMGRYITKLNLILRILFRYRLNTIANQVKAQTRHLNLAEGPKLWFRLLFAPFLTSKHLYRIWHRVPTKISESLFFVQDFYTPISKTDHLLNKFIDQTQIYPIWLCPIKNSKQGQFLSPHYCEERMINIGLYGIPKGDVPLSLLTERLEKELYEGGGKKMLYSYTYYDEALFSKIYDRRSYDKLRKKYGADQAFLSLYEKVTNKS